MKYGVCWVGSGSAWRGRPAICGRDCDGLQAGDDEGQAGCGGACPKCCQPSPATAPGPMHLTADLARIGEDPDAIGCSCPLDHEGWAASCHVLHLHETVARLPRGLWSPCTSQTPDVPCMNQDYNRPSHAQKGAEIVAHYEIWKYCQSTSRVQA